MKRYKREYPDKLEIGEVFYAKRFALTVDRSRCRGCAICSLICPREAITVKPISKGPDGKVLTPVIDIDENKCDFHAICAAACPFSAIKIAVNGQEKNPSLEKEVFPALIRDIEIDSENCKAECKICEEKCPFKAISVRFRPVTPEESNDRKKQGLPEQSSKTIIEIKKELCTGCQICQSECPAQAVRVTKFFNGSIRLNQQHCPEGCSNCLEVCPVKALYLDENKQVQVNDRHCIYCGACSNVCPKPEALELKRTSINHLPVRSGAWNKALEKLTSTAGLETELAAGQRDKVRQAINNLWLSRQ